MKPILYYDAECPVCTAFMKKIVSDVGDSIECRPAPKQSKSFRYVRSSGATSIGADALKWLLNDFPSIAPSLNILPAVWKEKIVGATVKAAGVLREALGKFQREGTTGAKGGCNCGSK